MYYIHIYIYIYILHVFLVLILLAHVYKCTVCYTLVAALCEELVR